MYVEDRRALLYSSTSVLGGRRDSNPQLPRLSEDSTIELLSPVALHHRPMMYYVSQKSLSYYHASSYRVQCVGERLFVFAPLRCLCKEARVFGVLQVLLPECAAQGFVKHPVQPCAVRAVLHRGGGDEGLEVYPLRITLAHLSEARTVMAHHHAVVFLSPLGRLNHHRVALREVPNQLVLWHRQPHALRVPLEEVRSEVHHEPRVVLAVVQDVCSLGAVPCVDDCPEIEPMTVLVCLALGRDAEGEQVSLLGAVRREELGQRAWEARLLAAQDAFALAGHEAVCELVYGVAVRVHHLQHLLTCHIRENHREWVL